MHLIICVRLSVFPLIVGAPVFQIESFIRAHRVVSVEPHLASAEHIGEMILGAFYVLHGVVVDLEVCLYIE